jgi:LysM repeat protein
VAVLIVRAGLDRDSGPPGTTGTTSAVTEPGRPQPPTRTTPGGARLYRVRAGDTLEGIAARFGTSVERLLELNPRVDPVALSVGQQIRVS